MHGWKRFALVGMVSLSPLVSSLSGAQAQLGAFASAASKPPAAAPTNIDDAGARPPNVIRKGMLLTKAEITEIAARGAQVAALVPIVGLWSECPRAIVWKVSKRALVQISDGYRACDPNSYTTAHALTFSGSTIAWRDFWCGNEAYDDPVTAVLPSRVAKGKGGDPNDLGACTQVPGFKRPKPQAERVRGITMTPRASTIRVHRLRDDRVRTLRVPEHIVGADLTTAGLFYAYNTQHQRYSGHLVFVPRSQLFS